MHVKSSPCCVDHFSGSGERQLTHFVSGPLFQVGSGLLSDIYQRLSPVFTKRVGPYLGRKLVSTGRDIVERMRQGSSLREAVKKGIGRTYRSTRDEFLQKLQSGGGHKRKACSQSCSVSGRQKKRKVVDFFDT